MMSNHNNNDGEELSSIADRVAKRRRLVATSSTDEDQLVLDKEEEENRIYDNIKAAKRQQIVGSSPDEEHVVLNEEEKEIYDDVVSDLRKHDYFYDRYNGTGLELGFYEHYGVFNKNHAAAKMIRKVSKYITKNSPSKKVVSIVIVATIKTSKLEVGGIKILLSPFMTTIATLTLYDFDEKMMETLPQTLRHCSSLKELELSIKSSSLLLQLARLIEHAPSLQSLKLRFDSDTSSVFEDADMESITDLALCVCRLEEVKIYYFPGSLASHFLETLCSESTAIRKLELCFKDEWLFPWTTEMTDAILKSTTLETFCFGWDPTIRHTPGYTEAVQLKIQTHLEINKARGLLEYHATKEQQEKEGTAGSSSKFPDGLWANAIEKLTSSPNGNPTAAYLLVRSQLPQLILNNNNNNNNHNNSSSSNSSN